MAAAAPSPPPWIRLRQVVAALRAKDGGCPWDLQQTKESMAPHLLEEAYEAVEAIEGGDAGQTCEELGDVLMNVFLVSQIAEERGEFTVDDVAEGVADKLVRRHPHVFGGARVADAGAALRSWEAIKREEGGSSNRSVLAGVPNALPALLLAARVGAKAARVGFDWPDRAGPRAKLDEELGELDAACATGDRGAVEAELGDVLFSVTNLARHLGVDPETALRGSVKRFRSRFAQVEARLGARLGTAALAEMEAAWQQAKETAPGHD